MKKLFHRVLAATLTLALAPAQAVTFSQTAGGPQSVGAVRLVVQGDGDIYTIASDGIFKTTDSGVTWTRLAGAPPARASSLALVGSDIYAAAAQGVFRSADDGASWTSFSGEAAGALPPANWTLISGGSVVLAHAFYSGGGHLFRSAPGGAAAWVEVTPPGIGSNGVDGGIVSGDKLCVRIGNSGLRYSTNNGDSWSTSSGANGSFAAIAASPTDASRVYLANFSGGVFRSINGCQSFSSMGFAYSGLTGVTVRGLGVDAGGQVYVGAEATADGAGVLRAAADPGSGQVTFNPVTGGSLAAGVQVSAYSFAATGGGILASTGGRGVHFRTSGDWAARNSGLVGAQVGALADLGPAGDLLVSAGTVLATLDGGINYDARDSGLTLPAGGAMARKGTTIVASIFSPGSGSQPPGAAVSTDDGATWTQLQSSSGLTAGRQLGALVTDGSAFYGALDFGGGIFNSADGLTWTQPAATGLPSNPSVRNLAVRNGALFAYVGNQGIFRSADGGASWTNISADLIGNSFLGKIFAWSGGLIASAGGKVFRSTNNGDNWTLTTGHAVSQFGIEILSLAADADGNLYLGDEHAGLSISTDGGATWTPDSDGLRRSAVCIERINALLFKDGKLYAGQGENGGVLVADPIGAGTPGDSVACTTDTDIFPNAFSFTAQNNVAPDAELTSNTIFVAGLGTGVSVPIAVEGGFYSKGCTTFTSAPGEVANGDQVCVRHVAAATGETATNTRLTIGHQSAVFTSRTGLVYTGRDDEINTTFGNNGFASASGVGEATDVRVLADGSIVVGSGIPGFDNAFAITKYTAAGALDASFGSGGKTIVQFGSGSDVLASVLPLPNGKFMLVGWTAAASGNSASIGLARINADGAVDTAFGTNGLVTFDINPAQPTRFEIVGDAALLADGSILAVGGVVTNSTGTRFFAVKFSPDGVVDTAFGANDPVFADGVAASTSMGTISISGNAVVVQSTGGFIVAGLRQPSFSSIAAAAVRFNADGTQDDSFGTSGVAALANGTDVKDALLAAGDKIVLVGNVSGRPLVVQLMANGALDTGFAGDGVFSLDAVSGGLSSAEVLAGGDIAAIGSGTGPGGTTQLLYVRLDSDGTLDSSFGPGGQGYVFRGPVNGSAVSGRSSALRSDGGLLVGGLFGSTQGLFVFGGQGGGSGSDTTPEAFTFIDRMDVATSTTITSNTITVGGIDAPAAISVAGFGQYSVGCTEATFTTQAGTVSNGQTVCVRHDSAPDAATARDTVLTIGGVADTFTSTTASGPPDTTPDSFSFTDVTGVEPLATVTSNSITVTGINQPATISVTGGTYAIGCTGSFGSSPGSISNGQTVCVRHIASGGFETPTDTSLSIGGLTGTFRSTTRAASSTPAPFSFVDQTGVTPSAVITSQPVTLSGFDGAVAISVTGGSYAIGCTGSFVTADGTISSGQSVCVRHTAASAASTTTDTVLTVGGVSDTFTSTTAAPGPDTMPDAFIFDAVTFAEPGSVNESNVITVSGINTPASISVTGDGEYRIGAGAYGTGAATVSDGQTVQLRITAPAFGQSASASLSIGGVTGAFNVSTRAAHEDAVSTPGGDSATVASSAGTLMNLANSATPPAGAPAGFTFPDGFFSFDVEGITAGATVTVTLTLPAGSAPDAYIKCDAAGASCERFAGAVISGNVVTLTLTDGGAGDADGMANGTIRDPGAPAVSGRPFGRRGGGGALGWGLLLPMLAIFGMRSARRAKRVGKAVRDGAVTA